MVSYPTVKLWDDSDGECVTTFEGHSSLVNGVDVRSGSDTICSASDDYPVRLWDLAAKASTKSVVGHSENVRWVQFNSNGKQLMSYSYDYRNEEYRVTDCLTGECIHQSNEEPSPEIFDPTDAPEKYEAYYYGFGDSWIGANTRFHEKDVAFSGDNRTDRDAYFYTNHDGHRVVACYVDGKNVHILRAADA